MLVKVVWMSAWLYTDISLQTYKYSLSFYSRGISQHTIIVKLNNVHYLN